MTLARDSLELERLENLVKGFGWVNVRQDFSDTTISVTVERPRNDATGAVDMERLRNLTSGFGWKITKQEFTGPGDTKNSVTLEKDRAPDVDVAEAGPD